MLIQILNTLDSVATLAALAVGYVLGKRRTPNPPEPMKPICSCEHGYGTHDAGKKCGAEVLPKTGWYESAHELRPCPCKSYDGPDPAIFGISAP